MPILKFLFYYVSIQKIIATTENQIICNCINGFTTFPSDVIGWKCSGNNPGFEVCNGSYSKWDGVECQDNHIVGIFLSFYGIEGTISSSFGSLIHLNYLLLDNNIFSSTIPSSLGDLLELTLLDLDTNYLSGSIPTSIGKLSNLETFYIHQNYLSGSIPSTIGFMRSLANLRLYSNLLTSTIPSSIGQLTNLKKFSIFSNIITGLLPSSLGNLESLTLLRIDYNDISGELPSTLIKLTNIGAVIISNNMLTGIFPQWLGNLQSLNFIGMDFNKFTGTLPSTIGYLTNVVYFNPSVNKITGTIPTAIGLLSGIMEEMYFNNNLFTGTIPSVFKNFTNLLAIDFSANKMVGTIPAWLWQLPTLYILGIGENRFTGTLPSTITYATNLDGIDIGANSLTGTIPSLLGSLISLTYISLRFNSFTGTLPPELGMLTNLLIIYVQSNQLTGSIPMSFKNMTYLSKIFISSNSMTGTIPSHIWNSPYMIYYDFSNNKLTGTIPSSICNATSMQKLSISDTLLHGTIPSEIGYLTNLQYLYLSSNQLTGTLPITFGKLKLLLYLELHSNAFHGTIPSSLRTLPYLVDLYLRGNLFEGPFNEAINTSYQTMLRNIDVSDNYLTGTIPDTLFFSSTLVILAATSNCLDFPKLEAGCTASQLQVLSLDGLRTAEKCRKFFWPDIASSKTYSLEYEGVIRIPDCFYSLPQLSVLHLSGNALTGTIPADVELGDSLTDLTLSYNRLHGPIPESIQNRNWSTLDLSFNGFSGTLSSSIPTVSNNNKLALTVNRLSGLVPQSLLHSSDISILKGNIFECDFNNAKLPSGDSDSLSYSCGSDTFLLALYIFFGALLTSSITFFLLDPINIINYVCTLYPVNNGSDISKLIIRFCVLFGVMAMFILCVMMPVFGSLSYYYGTHTNAYAWSVSAGFLSGQYAKIIMLVVWSVMLLYFRIFYSRIFKSSKLSIQMIIAPEQPVETMIDANPRGIIWDNMVLFLLFLINVVVVFGANTAYVFTTLQGDVYAVTIAQILLGIFKLFWRYGYIEYIGNFRDYITGHTHRNKHELLFLSLMQIINNVVLPVFSEVVIDSNCIYNMFVPPEAVTATYSYDSCYLQAIICNVVVATTVDITYTPPFIYRYQCSAIVITNYVSVFTYMYIFTALQIPVSSLVIWFRSCFKRGSFIYRIFSLGIHQLHEDTPYLNYPLYVAGLISSLAVMLTFGAAFPPLALIIMIANYVDAIYVTNNLPQEEVPVTIDDLGISVYLIPFSALFFSFFLYDTADFHKNSWVNLWPPMIIILMSLLYNGVGRIIKTFKKTSKRSPATLNLPSNQSDTIFDNLNAESSAYIASIANSRIVEGEQDRLSFHDVLFQSQPPPTSSIIIDELEESNSNNRNNTMVTAKYIVSANDIEIH